MRYCEDKCILSVKYLEQTFHYYCCSYRISQGTMCIYIISFFHEVIYFYILCVICKQKYKNCKEKYNNLFHMFERV